MVSAADAPVPNACASRAPGPRISGSCAGASDGRTILKDLPRPLGSLFCFLASDPAKSVAFATNNSEIDLENRSDIIMTAVECPPNDEHQYTKAMQELGAPPEVCFRFHPVVIVSRCSYQSRRRLLCQRLRAGY